VKDERDPIFVPTDLFRVVQRGCGSAQRYAVAVTTDISGRFRIAGRDACAIGLGIVGATRGG
jgi:hypothetical protein